MILHLDDILKEYYFCEIGLELGLEIGLELFEMACLITQPFSLGPDHRQLDLYIASSHHGLVKVDSGRQQDLSTTCWS